MIPRMHHGRPGMAENRPLAGLAALLFAAAVLAVLAIFGAI